MGDATENEKSIFLAAIERIPPEQWPAFLEKACAGDDALRARVEHLLSAQAKMGSFHEAPRSLPVSTVGLSRVERPGDQIGPYKLLQEVGQGGMGVVYLAEQLEPVRRKVALKIIKPGMDTRQVIARFEAERQALSLMDHPNIAKVLDAGMTGSGRPYFVMELVKGQPMTQYCDNNQLTPRQRLELFLPVCQAIQHAHQKGIIHRDIKPSNILVAEYDQQPVPKVIDFGVAKATNQPLTEKTMFTGLGQIVGTLEYMSPEQAKVNQLDIDTRSDIYSLGVLLYELLTGSTPFDKQRLRSAAWDEMLRIIREEEPPKPSTRLSDSHDALPSICAQRHTQPAKLSKLVRGELDWIVMKALEKDRNRRYESANGLAADLLRYLADEPVQACSPSVLYKFRKFARRNKRVLMTLTLLGAMLIAAVVTLAVSAALVWREKDRTQAANDQLKDNLRLAIGALDEVYLKVVEERFRRDPQRRREDQELLRKALAFYEQFARRNSSDPDVRFEMGKAKARVGNIRQVLREFAEAEEAFDEAIRTLKQLASEFATETPYRSELAAAYHDLGSMFHTMGQAPRAEKMLRQAIKIRRALATQSHRTEDRAALASSLTSLGLVLQVNGRLDEAEQCHQQAARLWEQLAAKDTDQRVYWEGAQQARNNLGLLYLSTGRREEALQAFRGGLELARKLVATSPSRLEYQAAEAMGHLNYGLVLNDLGRYAEAEPEYHQTIALYQTLVRELPMVPHYRHALAKGHINLGLLLSGTRRPAEAESVYQQAIKDLHKLTDEFPDVPEYQSDLALAHLNMTDTLRGMLRFGEAEQSSREALGWFDRLVAKYAHVPLYRRDLALSHLALGGSLVELGELPKAEQACRQAIRLQEELLAQYPNVPDYKRDLLGSYQRLAAVLNALQRPAEAEAALRRGLVVQPEDAQTHFHLGSSMTLQGKWAEAEVSFRAAARLSPDDANTHYALGLALKNQGQLAEAEAAYLKAIGLQPGNAMTHNNLGVVYLIQEKWAEAETQFREALRLMPELAQARDNLETVLHKQGNATVGD